MWTPVTRLDQEMSSESRRETSQGGSQASFEEQEPEPESALSSPPFEPFLFLAFNPLKTGGVMDALVAET